MKRLLPPFVLCLIALCAPLSHAARSYFDGGNQSNGTLCPVTGNGVTVLQSYAGYYTDPSEPYPRAGDLAYVHAVGVNVSPCVNDVVGFEFFLPLGANLAITASTPVYCIRGKLDGTFSEYVPNGNGSACSQTPSIGTNGGLFFGYSGLPPGWFLEVQVPVVFTQQLLGLAGPTSHRLTVATSSTYGTVFPYQPVTVFQAAAAPTLTVTKSGTGTVTSNTGAINCGTTCAASFAAGSSVTLTASPGAGWIFAGWTAGPCAGSNPSCVVTMNSAQSVTAQFARATGSLSVTLAGLPAGSIVTLTIAGPDGFSSTNNVLVGTGFNLSDVPTGAYSVSAPATTVGVTTYNAPTQSAVVSFGSTATINVVYSSASLIKVSREDLSGDGKSDLLTRDPTGALVGRLMNGTSATSSATLLAAGPNWNVTHTGDLNGDGKADLLFRNINDGAVVLYLMNGLTVQSSITLLAGGTPAWSIAHVADFNGDGRADILWRNTDGRYALWLMSGGTVIGGGGILGPGPWIAALTGDFDGDGRADILWRNNTDGSYAIWLMNGTTVTGGGGILGAGPWVATHAADFNGDGKADILWRSSSDGTVAMWLMNGATVSSGGSLIGPSPWIVTHVGDLNGDGKADVLWRNSSDGTVAAWLMSGLSLTTGTSLLGAGSGWTVQKLLDFNGDGKSDIVWRHTDGTIAVWLMNGLALTAGTTIAGPGTNQAAPLP
jgi:hypothetical protein